MMLQFNQLAIGYSKRKQAQVIHEGLTGSLQAGQLVCLMGANGAGKSTLLRTLANLQPALSGEILLHQRPLTDFSPTEIAKNISVVLTQPLPGNLRVQELVQLGRYPHTGWLGKATATDSKAVRQALVQSRLTELANRRLDTLSDGQRQKALIARALAQDGQLLLLDEPTAHLDLPHRLHIMQLLHQIAHQQKKAVLVTTHELDLALQTADQLWLLPEEPAAALIQGMPEDLLLQEVFPQVFAHAGLQFELASGRFVLPRTTSYSVHLQGPEPAFYWTQKALLRYGIATKPQGLQLRITVSDHGWQWHIQEHSFLSLQALITHLQQVFS